MAAYGTLKPGDVVTHPEWVPGTTRVIGDGVMIGTRGSWKNGHYSVHMDRSQRYLQLTEPVKYADSLGMGFEEDDYWAEAGLEKVL